MRSRRGAPGARRAAALLLAAIALGSPLALVASGEGRAPDFWAPRLDRGEARGAPVPGAPEPGIAAAADELLAAMSDGEKLGQLLMFAYPGTDPGEEILGWVRERGIGGVKIFGWNADDTTVLARAIGRLQAESQQTRLKVPLFIATDQEGGWIRHVKGKTSVTPGNMAIGASGLPMDAYWSAWYISRELAALGINMNFAPTVDLFTAADSAIIGPRSFGDDPVQAGVLGAAYYRGSRAAGIICTAKHFPGHGDTALDSHGVLPVIGADKRTIDARELVPYRILAREGVPAVMSGHLNYPAVTGDALPASMSAKFLRDILRGELDFRGLVITDDLAMAGAGWAPGGVGGVIARALEAGNDVAMLSGAPSRLDPFWDALLARMGRDGAFRAAIEASARRVLALKLEYLRRPDAVPLRPDPAALDGRLPDPGARAFFLEQAFRSVTALGSAELPYLPAAGEKVLVAGQFGEYLAESKRYFPGADRMKLAYMPSAAELAVDEALLFARAPAYDCVILCLANATGLSHLEALRGRARRLIVVSALSPYWLSRAPWVKDAVLVYSFARESFQAGFAAIAGAIVPEGRLPYGRR